MTANRSTLRHVLSDTLSVILPPSEDTLLLRACLLPGDAGRHACETWLKRHDDPRNGLAREFVKAFLPMLFSAVQAHGIELDNSRLTILRTAAFREELRSQTYRQICRKVFSALVQKRVSAIVIKGAAFAETVYSNPALRHSHDIEVLLQERELDEAASSLAPLGFAPCERASRRSLKGVAFVHQSGLPLILHVNLFQIPFYNSALSAIRSRSQTMAIAGIPMRVLSPADALLHTCGQAAYAPSRGSYRWISDAWCIIRRHPELDWDLLLDCAQRSHLALPVSLMLGYLSKDLNAQVPWSALDRLSLAASKSNALERELALFGARSSGRGGFRNLIGMTTNWRSRALIIQWMLFPSPTYVLWVSQSCRFSLLPVQYCYRPVRYVWRQLRASLNNVRRRFGMRNGAYSKSNA